MTRDYLPDFISIGTYSRQRLTAGFSGALPREPAHETGQQFRADEGVEMERGEASAANDVGLVL